LLVRYAVVAIYLPWWEIELYAQRAGPAGEDAPQSIEAPVTWVQIVGEASNKRSGTDRYGRDRAEMIG
jgi:hypothetical protein